MTNTLILPTHVAEARVLQRQKEEKEKKKEENKEVTRKSKNA
jgi:hypothetical protein